MAGGKSWLWASGSILGRDTDDLDPQANWGHVGLL